MALRRALYHAPLSAPLSALKEIPVVCRARTQTLSLIISSGQPARAPELLGLRYRNTRNGGTRNIFVEHGQIVPVTAYHKGVHIDGSTKIIHRYLSQEVGELLVYYLWLVEPFQRQLEPGMYGEVLGKGYLWEQSVKDCQWTPDRISQLLLESSLAGMGVQLNISACRNVAIAMVRKYLGAAAFMNDDDQEELDDQPSHAIHKPSVNSALDLQAGHSSRIAGMIYARELSEINGEISYIRYQYRATSQACHKFLHFPSILHGSKRKATWDLDADHEQHRNWKQTQRINIHDGLTHLVGPNAQFRGIQE
ncbi:hypothetical protein MMC22_004685 [Lobaria immixta]|nr:hypothetical protein [Lobaria immixta]